MAKIERKAQKIFAGQSNTDEKAVFGSMKSGTGSYSDDIEQLQSADYEQGWQNSIVLEKAPFLEEMNGVQYGLSKQIAYLLQQGIAEWDANTTYYANTSFCQVNGTIYQSLTDDNIGNNPVGDVINWRERKFGDDLGSDFLNKSQVTNCILSAQNGSITTNQHTAAYLNQGCTISGANIASGFSADNYILLNKVMPSSTAWVFTVPIVPASATGTQTLYAINNYSNSVGIEGGVLVVRYNGEKLTGTTQLAVGTAYTVRFTRTASNYTLAVKQTAQGDESYTTEVTIPSDLDYFGGKTVYLGADRTNYFNGTIDLASMTLTSGGSSYWTINTSLTFQTVTVQGNFNLLMPNARNLDKTMNNEEVQLNLNTTLIFNPSTSGTKTVLLKENGELMICDSYEESDNAPNAEAGVVWFDKLNNQMKEQAMTLPNILNTGCTFVDGVASNFSQNNYLQLPSTYNLGSSWSMSIPINIVENSSNAENVIIGDYTKSGSSIIPDSLALVYDGDETVTLYLRREDVYNVQKESIVSTAYTVTTGTDDSLQTGYVSVQGAAESYVPADTQIYADTGLQTQLTTAPADTWTYTGDSTNNTTTSYGFVRPAGNIYVPASTQVYSNADLTTPLEVANGSDWLYMSDATSVSMIGALNATVTAGSNTLALSYDGTNYTFNSQTLASTDVVRGNFQMYIGSAPSTSGAYFNSTIDFGNAKFSFYQWNGITAVEPNYTVQGSVTVDTNGVASGFNNSSSNKIILNGLPSNLGAEPWVIVTKANMASADPNTRIIGPGAISKGSAFGIVTGNTYGIWVSGTGTEWDIADASTNSITAVLNSDRYYKFEFTGAGYYAYYSETKLAWDADWGDSPLASVNSTTPQNTSAGWQVILGGDTTLQYFNGTIDLSETFIYVNNELVWSWNGVTQAGQDWQPFVGAKIGEITVQPLGTGWGIDEMKLDMPLELTKNGASRDLDNLSTEGENHFLNKRQISNCILEAPRRVKIEMNGKTITIKAGSRLSFPNGFDIKGDRIFDEVILENDLSLTTTPPGTYQAALGVVKNDIGNYYISYIGPLAGGTNYPATYSGPTQPVSGAGKYAFWYNTTQNKVFMIENGSVNTDNYATFPIAYISVTAEGFQNVHQYYDVCSYCGQWLFIFPGVKFLIPDGFNEDGSLRNIEVTTVAKATALENQTSRMIKLGITSNAYGWGPGINGYVISDKEPVVNQQYFQWMDTSTNYMKYTSNTGASWIIDKTIYAGTMSKPDANGSIQGITPAEPVNLVKMDDYNVLQNRINGMKTYVTTTYVNGNTWYRIWSDGWKEQGGQFNCSASELDVSLPLTMSNTNYCLTYGQCATGYDAATRWPTVVTAIYTNRFHFRNNTHMCYYKYYVCGY